MKSYKECEKMHIGSSDKALLFMRGYDQDGIAISEPMAFGEDGSYSAYIIKESDIKIGNHYICIASFYKNIQIFDDDGLAFSADAEKINIYSAGNFGCIIQFIDATRINEKALQTKERPLIKEPKLKMR